MLDRVLAGDFYSNTMLLLKAETPEPRGRRAGPGRGQWGPVWMGVPPKNTHQSSHITSLPSCLIGWEAKGEEMLKIEVTAHFGLMSPWDISTLSRSHPCLDHDRRGEKNISTPGTSAAFTRLLCVFNQVLQYITHVQPHRYMTHTHTHT